MTPTILSIWKGAIPHRHSNRTCGSSAHAIVQDIAQQYGLTVEDLKRPSRRPAITRPRQHAMWALRQTGRYSLTAIGQFFGAMDHSSVVYAIKAHIKRVGG